MTLCPYALVSSCSKCPIVKICPLKSIIGDAKPKEEDTEEKDSSNS